jgi:hypothetical protein
MTFTLDDAIRHEKEMADSGCGSTERANEHRQIAFWLEELKTRRSANIPMACKVDDDGNAICPVCGADAEWHKFCEECGQALKWREKA